MKGVRDFKKVLLALVSLILVTLSLSCGKATTSTSSPTSSTKLFSTTSTPVSPATYLPSQITSTSTTALDAPSSTDTIPSTAVVTSGSINPNWTPPILGEATLPADLSGIAAKVLSSVVSINVQVNSTNFFGQPTTEQGAGSGWIIDSNGLIVTNNHVVQGAQNISVSLNDGRNFPAVQVATDPIGDLAIIKIVPRDFRH